MMLPGSFDATIEAAPAGRPASHVAVVLPPVSDAASLDALERAWLGPALAWLARGRIASVALVTDGARATTWSAQHPSLAARARAAIAPRRFELTR
jgi:hypothetical protein